MIKAVQVIPTSTAFGVSFFIYQHPSHLLNGSLEMSQLVATQQI